MSNLGTVFIPRAAYYYEQPDKKYFKNLAKYSVNICTFIVVPAIVSMMVLSIPICALISGNTDLVNNAYGNNDKFLDYALSNKLYYCFHMIVV